jgi:hypothetical protein
VDNATTLHWRVRRQASPAVAGWGRAVRGELRALAPAGEARKRPTRGRRRLLGAGKGHRCLIRRGGGRGSNAGGEEGSRRGEGQRPSAAARRRGERRLGWGQ